MTSIRDIMQYLRSTDLVQLKINTSVQDRHVYGTGDLECAYVVKYKQLDDFSIFECFVSDMGYDFGRLTYIFEHDKLNYDLHVSTSNTKNLTIRTVSSITNEQFFQLSTVQDTLDLEFEDIEFFVSTADKFKFFAQGLLDANTR